MRSETRELNLLQYSTVQRLGFIPSHYWTCPQQQSGKPAASCRASASSAQNFPKRQRRSRKQVLFTKYHWTHGKKLLRGKLSFPTVQLTEQRFDPRSSNQSFTSRKKRHLRAIWRTVQAVRTAAWSSQVCYIILIPYVTIEGGQQVCVTRRNSSEAME